MTSVILDYSNLSEKKLIEIKENYILQKQKLNDKISNLSHEELNWKNVFGETIHFNNTFIDKAYLNMKDFYTLESIRELCSDLSSELSITSSIIFIQCSDLFLINSVSISTFSFLGLVFHSSNKTEYSPLLK